MHVAHRNDPPPLASLRPHQRDGAPVNPTIGEPAQFTIIPAIIAQRHAGAGEQPRRIPKIEATMGKSQSALVVIILDFHDHYYVVT